MIPFKFFRGKVYSDEFTLPIARRMSGRTIAQDLSNQVQQMVRSPEYIPAGYINTPYIPLQITEPRGINACIMEGWRANRDNLPPGQCPYDIGTPEREHWMTGWSSRENREPRPYERF